jgi:hypothetical protein
MRISSFINGGLFAIGAVLLIVQLWFSIWALDVFIKIELTIAIILFVSLVFSFLFKESEATKKIKNGDDL